MPIGVLSSYALKQIFLLIIYRHIKYICARTHMCILMPAKLKPLLCFSKFQQQKKRYSGTFHKKEAYNLDITVFLRIFALPNQEFLII